MAGFEPERCYFCKKLFCCEDCCENHIRSKHPNRETDCPLCCCEPLIVRNFHCEQLLYHVVFNHLPLRCRKCNELFENIEDLKAIGTCHCHPLIRVQPSPLNQTPHKSSLIDQKEISIDSDYNCNFDNFTSPPELSRGTSTPVHAGTMKEDHSQEFKTIEKIPNIILSTSPLSITSDSEKNISVETPKFSSSDTESTSFSGQSFEKSNTSVDAPLRSILLIKSTPTEFHQQGCSKKLSQRKLASMEELNEDITDMELTDAIYVTPPTTNKHSELKDSVKKVRFIDQLDEKIKLKNKCDTSEIEDFFETSQNFREMSISIPHDANMNKPLVKIIDREDCKNEEKVNDNNNDESEEKIKKKEPTSNQTSKPKSTTHIAMWVLIEQTGDDELKNFTPLIDSGLKKLRSVISKPALFRKNLSYSTKNKAKNVSKYSMISVNSYTNVSNVESYKTPDKESIRQKSRSIIPKITGLKKTGIFTAVTKAIKNTLKNFSEITPEKYPITEAISSKITSKIPSTSLMNAADKPSGITANSTMYSSRLGKRSREKFDSIPLESPEVSDIERERIDNPNDMQSPLQKRPRAWYRKIHGREPIARMKNTFSLPRGVSLEKQYFQKGSLTVGNTVIPLPSRAHQSTQTD